MNATGSHIPLSFNSFKNETGILEESAIITKVDAIIAQVLGISAEDIDDDLAYQSISAWDSLRHVTLMIALETEFGTKITDDLIVQLHSVRAIREFVRVHTTGVDAVASSTSPVALPKSQPADIVVLRGLEGVYVDHSIRRKIRLPDRAETARWARQLECVHHSIRPRDCRCCCRISSRSTRTPDAG